jgi:hypothetical protein
VWSAVESGLKPDRGSTSRRKLGLIESGDEKGRFSAARFRAVQRGLRRGFAHPCAGCCGEANWADWMAEGAVSFGFMTSWESPAASNWCSTSWDNERRDKYRAVKPENSCQLLPSSASPCKPNTSVDESGASFLRVVTQSDQLRPWSLLSAVCSASA